MSSKYYKAGGPVFLMIGGEGPASAGWMEDGPMWVAYAKQYNAMLLQVEHRFYGKSHPTPDLSDASLEFLNSQQALADLANFVTFASSTYNLKENTWISFGGSYSGALSAWMRMKYPHLISAAVASSAPVLAKYDFREYMEVIKTSLETTGVACIDSLIGATIAFLNKIQTSAGRDQLKHMFSLCDDIDVNNQNDIANLMEMLADNIAEVVQYNRDNIRRNITLNDVCRLMDDESIHDELSRFAKVNSLLMKLAKEECLDFIYSKMIKDMKQTSWNSSAANGERQWVYQTCTEFAYFQSSDSQEQPFGDSFPVSFFAQQCSDIYGSKFTSDMVQRAVKNTNTYYGGLGISVSKIVFPNGSIDPWHALGVLSDLGPDVIAIFINGTAHCANMYPPRESDLPSLVRARAQIQKLIGQWV